MKSVPKYRIAMFAPAFAPLANPEAIVNSKLVLAMLDAGWDVDVFSRNLAVEWKTYNYGSEWIAPWSELQRVTHIASYNSTSSLARYMETGLSVIKTGHYIDGCRWAMHSCDLALRLHREKPYDFIISRSLPDAAHLPAMSFARKTGVPWIANWNDPSGDKNPPPYGGGPQTYLGPHYERLLKAVSQNASWFTFPSARLSRYICEYLELPERLATIIPHAAIRLKNSISHDNISDTFTICHAGHISSHRNPLPFLKGVTEFIRIEGIQDKFKLVIVGLDNVGILSMARELGIDKYINVEGNKSYLETYDLLARCDVLVILEAPTNEGIYLPAKFVDYVQTGKPILAITPRQSSVGDILSQSGGGIAADCLSSEDITAALRRMYGSWRNGTLQQQFSSDRLFNLFAPETIVNTYMHIFDSLKHVIIR